MSEKHIKPMQTLIQLIYPFDQNPSLELDLEDHPVVKSVLRSLLFPESKLGIERLQRRVQDYFQSRGTMFVTGHVYNIDNGKWQLNPPTIKSSRSESGSRAAWSPIKIQGDRYKRCYRIDTNWRLCAKSQEQLNTFITILGDINTQNSLSWHHHVSISEVPRELSTSSHSVASVDRSGNRRSSCSSLLEERRQSPEGVRKPSLSSEVVISMDSIARRLSTSCSDSLTLPPPNPESKVRAPFSRGSTPLPSEEESDDEDPWSLETTPDLKVQSVSIRSEIFQAPDPSSDSNIYTNWWVQLIRNGTLELEGGCRSRRYRLKAGSHDIIARFEVYIDTKLQELYPNLYPCRQSEIVKLNRTLRRYDQGRRDSQNRDRICSVTTGLWFDTLKITTHDNYKCDLRLRIYGTSDTALETFVFTMIHTTIPSIPLWSKRLDTKGIAT